jgi:hypothetical protein
MLSFICHGAEEIIMENKSHSRIKIIAFLTNILIQNCGVQKKKNERRDVMCMNNIDRTVGP